MYAAGTKENLMPIESLDNLGLIEKMENLVFMLLNEKDKFAIENILLHILNLSLNNWNEKFANILYKDEVINLFKEIVASSKMKVCETILKILSSISYYSEELDYKTTNYLTSCGILDMILNFLYIPQNPKELNTDICLNAIQLTLNLSVTSMKVKDYLLENNIFKILSDLLELAISTDQPIMIELLLQTIKSIIHNQNFLQKSDFEDIFPFVSKYFNDSPESENLINSLVILSESITYLREQCVNDSLVILLLDHLKSKDKAIIGICLECICKISSLENKYYIQVAINNNLMKYVSKIFTIPKNDWKAMCLLIFHNIAICFDTIFCKYNSKEIRYIKLESNRQPELYSSLKENNSDIKNGFVDFIIRHGALENVISAIKESNNNVEVVVECIKFIYEVLNSTYTPIISENTNSFYFQEIQGVDLLDELIDHKNAEVRKAASDLVDRFYKFEEFEYQNIQPEAYENVEMHF